MLEWAIENFGDHNCKMVRVITQKRAVRKTRQALKRSRSFTVGRRVPTGICRWVGAPYASPVLIVWKFVLMTSGEIRADKCTLRLPTSYWLYPTLAIGCIPPVILLEPQSLVVHGVYLVHADKCVNFLLTNNVLCLVSPIPCFYFCKDDLQGDGGRGACRVGPWKML